MCVLILKCMYEVHFLVQTSHVCADTEMRVPCGDQLCELHILVQTSHACADTEIHVLCGDRL